MTSTPAKPLNEVKNFVSQVALPPAPAVIRTRSAVTEPLRFDELQALAVGSQLTEFSVDISAKVRSSISNCVLLAQLAANKATDRDADPGRWYNKYTQVLTTLGWIIQSSDFQEQSVNEQDADLHEAIIPVIVAFMGPHIAATSMIVKVLKGLKTMEADSPWLTLFDRESQRFEARHFQFGFAETDPDGRPKVSLLCFQLQADKVITQVLFFKFSDASATLQKMATTLGIDATSLARIQPDLDAKLNAYIPSYIKSIDI